MSYNVIGKIFPKKHTLLGFIPYLNIMDDDCDFICYAGLRSNKALSNMFCISIQINYV